MMAFRLTVKSPLGLLASKLGGKASTNLGAPHRIVAKLKRIPDVAVDAARIAMEEGAQEIVHAMKAAAPVDSGDLRNCIVWTWGNSRPARS